MANHLVLNLECPHAGRGVWRDVCPFCELEAYAKVVAELTAENATLRAALAPREPLRLDWSDSPSAPLCPHCSPTGFQPSCPVHGGSPRST